MKWRSFCIFTRHFRGSSKRTDKQTPRDDGYWLFLDVTYSLSMLFANRLEWQIAYRSVHWKDKKFKSAYKLSSNASFIKNDWNLFVSSTFHFWFLSARMNKTWGTIFSALILSRCIRYSSEDRCNTKPYCKNNNIDDQIPHFRYERWNLWKNHRR